jgi:hypothetical protein
MPASDANAALWLTRCATGAADDPGASDETKDVLENGT